MSSLLRMKAWLLFVFLVSPIFFEIVLIAVGALVFATPEGPAQDEALFDSIVFLGIFVLSAVISAVILFCWIYAVATHLHAKLPQDHQLKIGRFRFAFFFPIFYIFVFIAFFLVIVESGSLGMALMIIPFHFLAIACMFYVFYFTAKSLKTVELQRRVSFGDYAGEFFLIWFIFIGVWFVQPRINALFAGDEQSEYGGPVDRYMK